MVLGFWFQNISTTFFLAILEKRAARSLAKSYLFLNFVRGLFSSAFSEGRQNEIFQFSFVSGSLEGLLFSDFFALLQFSSENSDPSFLHTLTAFWLDFQGLGPPRMLKMSKKGLLEKHRFLGFRKTGPKAVFLVFDVFLGSVLELPGDPKSQN